MKICLVHRDVHARTRGGICTVYRALAPRLAAAGHQVTVLTQDTPHPPVAPGMQLVTVPRTDNLDQHRTHVAAALATIQPDVVDASSWDAEVLTYLDQPHRAPVMVRGDLSAATMQARPALAAAERELCHRAELVTAVSAFAAADLAAAYDLPTVPQVLLNGVDRDWFHPGPATPPASGQQLTLVPGTATAATRHALTAADPPALWRPRGRRARLLWVGKPTTMKGWDRLEHLATELADLAEITVLLGHAPAWCAVTLTGTGDVDTLHDLDDTDVRSAYRAADALLSTSRWEGFGLAIAEALACGTPALVPAEIGTAAELLAAGGGATYRNSTELRAHLAALDTLSARLPAACDWDANAAATLAGYTQLLATTEVAA